MAVGGGAVITLVLGGLVGRDGLGKCKSWQQKCLFTLFMVGALTATASFGGAAFLLGKVAILGAGTLGMAIRLLVTGLVGVLIGLGSARLSGELIREGRVA